MFRNRSDFWNAILAIPAPRVLVLQDMDDDPGRGAFVGDVHAAILKALGCVGFVTNGAVRELPGVRRVGLQLFSGNLAVSHAYAHIFDVGSKVVVGALEVQPGELLHGDQHGVLTIPTEIAAQIPQVAEDRRRIEKRVIDFCKSGSFSVEKLSEITSAAR
jgi:4-hydroxy-4-methyl-2-oxoglutarate aldolase